jgi:hypothetical protein
MSCPSRMIHPRLNRCQILRRLTPRTDSAREHRNRNRACAYRRRRHRTGNRNEFATPPAVRNGGGGRSVPNIPSTSGSVLSSPASSAARDRNRLAINAKIRRNQSIIRSHPWVRDSDRREHRSSCKCLDSNVDGHLGRTAHETKSVKAICVVGSGNYVGGRSSVITKLN